ncbi:glycosyltransferase [Bacteroides helcogenes]|uniref:Glycosyl transferase family 2 n=1 Tax=Bacteroides helcogenes (strain ATCC 35417 / DSM 20613 / JCM 6297 / CCUG 15421 / P 36-108) TaxID=693979 RepID=E6SRF7_BACT6|nr:glycosyltransferase [Bacteroides helcogenes]ADV44060.1 glycosyl transferase family 2 [Bacteroides helcogenes P 36-108]MDY5237883.1 glycosyltransferase [Bacteroides helcogenes]
MEAFTFDNTEKILLASTGILFIVQTLYYYCLYNRIHARNKAVKRGDIHFSQELPPVSVIICAREESENLRRNLSGILEQDYPQFEVIVINDGDTDESEDYLTLLEEKYPHLYHSFVPDSSRYISRKKLAVTLGIKASKYEWLVFTDAKCLPQSNQWLRLMARNFTSRAQVVLGYSGYECGKGWLQRQICFDNLFTSMRYLGLALAGKPYMGIGRNLAYRKELFYQQKGFSAHLNLQRGDDDLFINHVATSENTRVETDADATMRMQPLTRSKDWREEKISYASTARLYHGCQRWIIGLETLTRLAFHGTWIALLAIGILNFHWLAAGIAFFLFMLRFTLQAVVINKAAQDLGEKRRYYSTLPIFDLLQPMQSLRWKLSCMLRKRSDFLRK